MAWWRPSPPPSLLLAESGWRSRSRTSRTGKTKSIFRIPLRRTGKTKSIFRIPLRRTGKIKSIFRIPLLRNVSVDLQNTITSKCVCRSSEYPYDEMYLSIFRIPLRRNVSVDLSNTATLKCICRSFKYRYFDNYVFVVLWLSFGNNLVFKF